MSLNGSGPLSHVTVAFIRRALLDIGPTWELNAPSWIWTKLWILTTSYTLCTTNWWFETSVQKYFCRLISLIVAADWHLRKYFSKSVKLSVIEQNVTILLTDHSSVQIRNWHPWKQWSLQVLCSTPVHVINFISACPKAGHKEREREPRD